MRSMKPYRNKPLFFTSYCLSHLISCCSSYSAPSRLKSLQNFETCQACALLGNADISTLLDIPLNPVALPSSWKPLLKSYFLNKTVPHTLCDIENKMLLLFQHCQYHNKTSTFYSFSLTPSNLFTYHIHYISSSH